MVFILKNEKLNSKPNVYLKKITEIFMKNTDAAQLKLGPIFLT